MKHKASSASARIQPLASGIDNQADRVAAMIEERNTIEPPPYARKGEIIFPATRNTIPLALLPLLLSEAATQTDDPIRSAIDFMQSIGNAAWRGELIVREKTGAVIAPQHLPQDYGELSRGEFAVERGDLTKFLSRQYSYVQVREETNPPPTTTQQSPSFKGITKGQALTAFALFIEISLENALEDVPKWIGDARLSRGTRGGRHSALWHPVRLAVALQDRYGIPGHKFNVAFQKHDFLQDWQVEWEETKDLLRDTKP